MPYRNAEEPDTLVDMLEPVIERVLRKPENRTLRTEWERNEKAIAEIQDAMVCALTETSYERMITAATVVARGFLPAMITRFSLRRVLNRLCQLEPPGPITIRLGEGEPLRYTFEVPPEDNPLPYAIGQTVKVARNDLWPSMKAGTRATVMGYEPDGAIRLDVHGYGPDFVTAIDNVEPVSR